MIFTQIVVSKEEGLGRVTLNRPEKRNALSRTAMRELVTALEEFEEDNDVRVLIITGAGDKAFCSGADINEFLNDDPREKRNQNEAYLRLCKALMEFTKPIVGAVNGLALAGGAGITLLFDFVVASDQARFGFPEIKAGIFPMMVTKSLFRTVGRRKALELVLTGETIDASEAERIGLINSVVTHGELQKHADLLARKLLRLNSSALRLGKEAITTSADMATPLALEYLKEMATIMLMSDEADAALKAIVAGKS